MSYIVLARKWRPRLFSELIGQETVSTILSNAIKQGRIAHAYLFSGPRGVGKTSTARILAKSLNCAEGPTPIPCEKCPSCIEIASGHSVDVLEIDGASNNSVEDIRDLRENVKYAPSTGRYKVYIIDEAHMLSQSAFNALLKTLEEPPSHVIFVLATTAPHKIPVTVLSRCQHLTFRRVSAKKMKEHLVRIAKEENIHITQGAIDMIVKASDGGMRDALTLLDQLNSFTDKITEDEIRDILGLTEVDLVAALVQAVITGNRRDIIDNLEKLHERGTDFKELIKDLIEFVREAMLFKISADTVIDVSETEKTHIEGIIAKTTEEELSLLLSELIRIEAEIRSAFSSRVALEVGLIRASMLSTLKPVSEIIKRLSRFETILNEQQAPDKKQHTEDHSVARPSPDKTDKLAHNNSFSSTDRAFNWADAVKTIEVEDSRLASKLIHASAELSGSTLTLTFNGGHGFLADLLKDDIPRIKEILSGAGITNSIERILLKKGSSQKKTVNPGKIEISPQERLIIEELGGRIVERRKRDV